MKILMVASYAGSFPYLDEMCAHLHARNIQTDLLDIPQLKLHTFTGGEKFDAGQPITDNTLAPILLRLPRIGLRFARPAATRWLQRHARQYDLAVIHYVSPELAPFLPDIRATAKALATVVWGSDFYRTGPKARAIQVPMYEASRFIIFGNPRTARDFNQYFQGFEARTVCANFGIHKLELLKRLMQTHTKAESRQHLGLPDNRLIVTCGYNAGAAQQHEYILDNIAALPESQKQSIHLVLPMTYGASASRAAHIDQYLRQKGLNGTVLTAFMTDEDIAHLRWATDLVINAQTTDSLSASLQEHLMAQNVLLVGDWLPYGLYKEMGIAYTPFEKSKLGEALEDVLANWETHHAAVLQNTDKIYSFSNWDTAINRWIAVFQNALA